ncbi:MAG: tRNA uridine(34) 5-carboxymethylaminomethyl modification radical SAM/GNAT enzyme Elp3 [Actinomycetia bacterium]|nr:tRNA uridine(34) 5-carboxymethylaminomethyl modification radical SAM/GNAT enzyme Elp3 [Actinomycetes bacterium]
MDEVILDIIRALQAHETLDEEALIALIRAHNKERVGIPDISKRMLLPYYLEIKNNEPNRWKSWNIDPALEQRLLQVLRMKPRRTASGVATISVITKPWTCSNSCLYCPSDVRMPKSYLCDEPACQRAERNYFDPYLQVASRLRVLNLMGHATDKVELIVLGGTFSDYPVTYQIWFTSELFRALNDADDEQRLMHSIEEREKLYQEYGVSIDPDDLEQRTSETQRAIDAGELPYNQAIEQLYMNSDIGREISAHQIATLGELEEQHARNETAQHRVVGLVVETRPDRIDVDTLYLLRQLGCTKIQMGIQSTDERILALNGRSTDTEAVQKAFELLRLFGFKTHTHFMRNLYGSDLVRDREDYLRFVSDPIYRSDEIKLYPCVLVEGAGLQAYYEDGSWEPYTEDELVELLATDVLNTPSYVRISRMIRDISADDIIAGNKKANLRQAVEATLEKRGAHIGEIRAREISTDDVDLSQLALDIVEYQTTNTNEFFLQWLTKDDRIAGFLRLSLPKREAVVGARVQSQKDAHSSLPIDGGEAMIREVHIYGVAAQLGDLEQDAEAESVQHSGLGRQLIDAASAIARDNGFHTLKVISSVGTRAYYRSLGFVDRGLYQQIPLGH